MCLCIPMQVIQCAGVMARCRARGVERHVSLFLLQHENIGVGDYVMVHRGEALQKMTVAEAEDAWAAFDEILVAPDAASAPEVITS